MPRRRIDLVVGEASPHDATRPAPGLGGGASHAVPRVSAIAASPVVSLSDRSTGTVARGLGQQADVSSQPDCRRCQHFAVSWEPAMPYLCRGFGFKSRLLPSWEVQQADGNPCRLFAARG
jgi:hypothetical protein